MPATTTRADLIAVTEKDYTKLARLIAGIPEEQAMRKRDEGTSIKDVIAHRAHWIDLFLGWYHDGQAGKDVAFPAPGYKWNQLKRYNADLRQRQADMDWDSARAMLADRHGRLLAFMTEKDDAALYGGPMKGANNDWTAGRWAEAAGPSHYRSAAKYIRACLRADAE
jgi:hypothetical protein